MKNYISINGMQIELTEDQVKQIVDAYGKGSTNQIQLSEVPVGETFRIGEHDFIVLEQAEGQTAVILKGLLDETSFGSNNNYDGSNVDKACRSFAEKLSALVGEENLLTHTVDLTSDDGLKDYGTIQRRVSSITAEMYRRFVDILDKYKPDEWWWLATPFSTEKHENSNWVKCVSPSGCINYYLYFSRDYGVRPFCILKSTIFVSR